jgi:hypothetical protein
MFQRVLNEVVFPNVKFVTKESSWHFTKPVPNMIMEAMNIEKNERERWWERECKDAKMKFNRRRNNCGRKIREVMEGKPVIVVPNGFVAFK